MESKESPPVLEPKLWFGLSAKAWFLIFLTLFFVGQSIKYAMKVSEKRSAIQRWQPQILGLDAGEDLSQKYQYPNPPIMALLLYPLAKMPPMVMALIWYYMKVVMLILCFHWIFNFIEKHGMTFPLWAKALTVLLVLRPITGDLQHGNVNIFILFSVIAGLHLYTLRWDVSGGLCIGLAIACKVTPALFIPYFLWKRSWNMLLGICLGLMLFLWPGVFPSLVLGFGENQKQLYSWYTEMVYPFVVEGKVWSEHNNQSLPGLMYRIFTHSPSFSDYVEGVYTPLEYHNVVDLPIPVIRLILKGSLGLFALSVVLCCKTPSNNRGGWALAAEFAIVCLGMLLFSERTWKHHCVTLILPFAVLCYFLAMCLGSKTNYILPVFTIVVATLLMTLTSTGLLEDDFAKEAQVYGCYVWAFILMIVCLFVLLYRNNNKTLVSANSID
ncbi:MAG: DUF2029 domain-containing protein [Planctomycetes bacterium]|nr:DUF2029 domain-containing protein [Planctomycetota bacterium]NBY00718.1 DUF2029 domain-containing protein [Planctomycetota bacterium]